MFHILDANKCYCHWSVWEPFATFCDSSKIFRRMGKVFCKILTLKYTREGRLLSSRNFSRLYIATSLTLLCLFVVIFRADRSHFGHIFYFILCMVTCISIPGFPQLALMQPLGIGFWLITASLEAQGSAMTEC